MPTAYSSSIGPDKEVTKIHEALVKAVQEKELFKKRVVNIQPRHFSFIQTPIEVENKMIGLYRSIYTQVPKQSGLTTQFIGAGDGEGASVLLREFAKVSAISLKKSVLLLDANSELDHLSHFSIKPKYCWEDIIRDNRPIEDAIYQIASTCLYVSQLSMPKNTLCTIFDSQKTEKHLEYLEKIFDLILIDMPPVDLSISCVALSHRLDGVVLVVEAGNTRWQSAYKLKENIELHGGKILGVIMNKRHHYIPKFIYKLL